MEQSRSHGILLRFFGKSEIQTQDTPGARDSPIQISRSDVPGPLALITPALFSRPPSRPDGRRGRNTLKEWLLEPSLSRQGGREAGRERVGRVRDSPEGATL